jgi:hypothetical protein
MRIKRVKTIDKGLDGLHYAEFLVEANGQSTTIHVITYPQQHNHLKLIASKSSEALAPNLQNNHVGEGGTFDDLVQSQPDLRFIINGTYNHYRKSFYEWQHDSYEVGDPVGYVKIRDNVYSDVMYETLNGYLVSEDEGSWKISGVRPPESKYVLSSRPLLIHNEMQLSLPIEEVTPVDEGVVNPPSFLGHGLQNHARTAVGASQNDELIFVVAEGEGAGISAGISLLQLQEFGTYLGLKMLLNLDGGGSSRFWLKAEDGTIFENRVADEDKNRILGHTLMMFSANL